MRIAFLGCGETLPGSPSRRADAFEHDRQFAALAAGLAEVAGDAAELTALDWRAPLAELARFDLALLGTAWDYTDRPAEFLARLEEMAQAGVQVCNPPEIVRWNADKGYLRELASRGAATIPTRWESAPDASAVERAFAAFDADRVVVKRQIGAGAVGQFSFTRDDPLLADWSMAQPAMIQPFLPAIVTEGEFSFVFIDGTFSHALRKQPRAGEYRIQSLYGGTERPFDPDPAERTAAAAVLALLPFDAPPLYARIDMVRLPDGRLAVIEAELIEPYLYPDQGPRLGAMLAAACIRRLKA